MPVNDVTNVMWPLALQPLAASAHLYLRGSPNHEVTVMRSLHHVFWRGAMALCMLVLSMLTLGIGSGSGFPQASNRADDITEICEDVPSSMQTRVVVDKRTLVASTTGLRPLRKRS